MCYPTKKTGKLYRIGNNWGPHAHPQPTQGEPAGGYYVEEKDMAKILKHRYAECFALSALEGIPAREDDFWNMLLNIILSA